MDKGASVIAKLKNKAKASGKPLQVHLQLFCQEEFLRKLSMSKYSDNLILKGGLFIYTLTNFESRATIDVDFLMKSIPNSIECVKTIMDEILAIDTGNDFIRLEAKNFEHISPQRKYIGISFQILGYIKNTRTPFSVDIGIGDVIVPKAEKRKIPVQIEDFSSPEISTYSLESTIAEKLDAILQRLEMTSRMKDFYDIYYLSGVFDFEGIKLQTAIFETLQRRGTSYSKDSLNQIADFVNDKDMNTKWKQFLKRIKVSEIPFNVVLSAIINFLSPIWDAIISENELLKNWSKDKNQWI